MDGARIWESQPFYDRPLSEIAALADSMYVSFYKGLGGLAGAALVGSSDFLAEARVWRSRMGGTIFRSTPEAVAALVGLRELLPRMAECLVWARSLATELSSVGITAFPVEPHTPTFLVFAPGDEASVNERIIGDMKRTKRQLGGLWVPSEEPGRVVSEPMVSVPALAHDPADVARRLGELVHG